MLYIIIALGVILLVVMVCALPLLTSTANKTAIVKIPANATSQNVRDTLTKYFGDNFSRRVIYMAKLRHTDFTQRHGAYRIEEGTNAIDAGRKLTSGAQTPVRITINGFRSISNLIERIASKLDMDSDDLSQVLYDPVTLRKYDLTAEGAMALFVDDSYDFYWSSTPAHIIEKIGRNYDSLWTEENRNKAAALGLKPSDVMIIASIVDEETNDVNEKGTIGRLYINRLKKGMKLQADPTVRFAANDFSIRRITGAHLHVQSPYNTYLNPGLPPGPIRTVGKQTVEDILNSKPNDYLYMCAKEDFSGTHNFAKDFSEHTHNALRYQHALDNRGIQ